VPFPSLLIARTGVHRAVAATGLLVIGAVDDASGGWTAPLLVILRAVALMAVAGTPAAGGRSAAAEERIPAPVAAGRSARG
jgi:CP family cyanate transporter-like MFS transporter